MVKALIEAGADVNKANDTVLDAAVHGRSGRPRGGGQGADRGGRGRQQGGQRRQTPLYWAAREGHEAVVKALIEAGADVNKAKNDGETPLYMAASNGHEAVVKALIEAGADVNKADDDGWTPLYMAAANGHEAVVKALIEAGADVNKARDDGGRRCTLPLQRPRGGGQGADRGRRGRQQGGQRRQTPLYMAAQEGHEAVVKALIEAGADVNKADDDGETPLYMAASKATRRWSRR